MGRKILLLESDQQLCSLITPLLEERGHTVVSESSGQAAVEAIPEGEFELIIVGEQLSDIDGIGWIIKFRQKDRKLKIVFLSQLWRGADFYQQVTKELKVDQVFHRPIKSTLFGPQIDALWSEKRMPPPGALDPNTGLAPVAGGSMPVPGGVPMPLGGVPLPGGAMQTPSMQPWAGSGGGGMPVPGGSGGALPMPGGGALPVPGGGVATVPVPSVSQATAIAAAADATLLAFRQKFSRSLPNRIKQICEAVESVDRANPSEKTLAEARRLSHNLKGTSRSCGFEGLGNVAELIENALRDMMDTPSLNTEAYWKNVDEALDVAVKESERVRVHCADYIPTPEELANSNPNSAKAKVLVVSRDIMPKLANPSPDNGGGIPLEIIPALNQQEAIEKATDKALDAALIEICPDQKGQAFQLARELRSMVGYDNLPLGFIYNYDEDGDRSEAAHAGASIFLEKPYGPETLRQVLQHLITIREGGRSRVLIVDDDEDFTELISVTLGNEGMLIRCLHDPRKVLDMLEDFSPDLMLLDVMMPGILGFEVCKKVREMGRWADLPILFLTAQTDLPSRLAAFDSGGDDYLVKPVIRVELLQRVKVRLDRARMQKERQDRDVLTGLLLRRAFVNQVGALLSESERHEFNFSLCLLDVDHFKKVNDSYGHMAGDRVLQHVGKLLRKRFRVEDVRGRWGGEEFILAFRHEKKVTMQKALNRVLEELSKHEFKGDNDESFYTTFSAGMVDFPDDGTTIHDLVLNADRRLYIAKQNGRKQIVIDG